MENGIGSGDVAHLVEMENGRVVEKDKISKFQNSSGSIEVSADLDDSNDSVWFEAETGTGDTTVVLGSSDEVEVKASGVSVLGSVMEIGIGNGDIAHLGKMENGRVVDKDKISKEVQNSGGSKEVSANLDDSNDSALFETDTGDASMVLGTSDGVEEKAEVLERELFNAKDDKAAASAIPDADVEPENVGLLASKEIQVIGRSDTGQVWIDEAEGLTDNVVVANGEIELNDIADKDSDVKVNILESEGSPIEVRADTDRVFVYEAERFTDNVAVENGEIELNGTTEKNSAAKVNIMESEGSPIAGQAGTEEVSGDKLEGLKFGVKNLDSVLRDVTETRTVIDTEVSGDEDVVVDRTNEGDKAHDKDVSRHGLMDLVRDGTDADSKEKLVHELPESQDVNEAGCGDAVSQDDSKYSYGNPSVTWMDETGGTPSTGEEEKRSHLDTNVAEHGAKNQLVEEPSNGKAEEYDETREKLQMIRAKFLRLAHRLGQTPHNVVVAQVLYRLGLAEQLRGRSGSRVAAFSFDRASAMAEQLEAAGQEPLDFSCTIMVLGKSGVGKSATINSIFDEVKFGTDAFDLGTKRVQDVVGTVQGIKVRVIDTPGLLPSWSDQRQNERILRSVKQFIKKTPPDIVLYLDRLDMPSRDFGDMPLLRTITETFGPSIWFNAIVVLTHAASAPPEGPSGTATSYDMFVTQRSHAVQQEIRQAAGDMRLMNPISLVENHSACRTNRAGQRVLPNGQVWKPHLLLLSFASKILTEVNTLLKLQESPAGRPFSTRSRAPPLPFLLSSLLQSRPQGNGKAASLDIDLQSVGKDTAYTLRGEIRFCNYRRNKATAGTSITILGDAITGGVKVEDKLIVNKRGQVVVSGGAMVGRGDVAYGGRLEATLRDKDHPLGRFLSTLALSAMDYHGDLALGCNSQVQIPVGRHTNLIGRVNINNRGSGQVSIRLNSSEQLQIALVALVPFARKLFGYWQPAELV